MNRDGKARGSRSTREHKSKGNYLGSGIPSQIAQDYADKRDADARESDRNAND